MTVVTLNFLRIIAIGTLLSISNSIWENNPAGLPQHVHIVYFESWLIQSYRHFSVASYITICPSLETYSGLYLRGAMSAVTGIYLSSATKYCIFCPEIFFYLNKQCIPWRMPHDGISPVCKCKKTCTDNIYFTIEMQPNIFFKVISCSIHVWFTCCNLRVGKFDVSASNMIIFWRQYFIKLRLMDSGKRIRRSQLVQANVTGTQ